MAVTTTNAHVNAHLRGDGAVVLTTTLTTDGKPREVVLGPAVVDAIVALVSPLPGDVPPVYYSPPEFPHSSLITGWPGEIVHLNRRGDLSLVWTDRSGEEHAVEDIPAETVARVAWAVAQLNASKEA